MATCSSPPLLPGRISNEEKMILFQDAGCNNATVPRCPKYSWSTHVTTFEIQEQSQSDSRSSQTDLEQTTVNIVKGLEQIPRTNRIKSTRHHQGTKITHTVDSLTDLTHIAKLREVIRLVSTLLIVKWKERENPYEALSFQGRRVHYHVGPINNIWGYNERVLDSPSLATVNVVEKDGSYQSVINASSHNYAGFYQTTPESEVLQQMCLDHLPIADDMAVAALQTELHTGLARFFDADFCYTSDTGYGSNLLAFPAILSQDWAAILDEKSHSSMLTGAYLANVGCVRKFPHNNMIRLEALLKEMKHRYVHILVAVEGFYSLDGTLPPLDVLSRLKKQYDLTLLCDEAHSFMSTGKHGRGCLELWNDEHPEHPLPADLIDMRTGTLSKAIGGGVGGFVCGKARFESFVRDRFLELHWRGGESLTSSAIVQSLYALGQPLRLQRKLRRLREMTLFCRAELSRFGIYVHGDSSAPVLPIHVGRPSWASKLSATLRQSGLLAGPLVPPAVKFWESRVRVLLSADFDDSQVNKLLQCIIDAYQTMGLIKKSKSKRNSFIYEDSEPDNRTEERLESTAAAKRIQALILLDGTCNAFSDRPSKLAFNNKCDTETLVAGHMSRQKYGLCSGASRWIAGTFQLHLQVEAMIARATEMDAAMMFTNAELGLCSTIAALCRPIDGYSKHSFLVPEKRPQAAFDGIRLALPKGAPKVVEYADQEGLHSLLESLTETKSYITLYIDSVVDLKLLFSFLSQHTVSKRTTLLFNNFNSIGNQLEAAKALSSYRSKNTSKTRILSCGSFYGEFGLPGGYLAGDKVLVDELRYTARAYMFTTSQQPFITQMLKTALERQLGVK